MFLQPPQKDISIMSSQCRDLLLWIENLDYFQLLDKMQNIKKQYDFLIIFAIFTKLEQST